MKKNMQKYLLLGILALGLLLSLAGCAPKALPNPNETPATAAAPIYHRSLSQLPLAEDMNPYMVEYTPNGFFYFAVGDGETPTSQFFYQAYDGQKARPFCAIEDGLVRAFSSIPADDGEHLAVLTVGEEACILEFDAAGAPCKKAVLDESFLALDEIVHLLALPDGRFIVSRSDQLFSLDPEGRITKTYALEGTVNKLLLAGENEPFALVWKNGSGDSLCLVKWDPQSGQVGLTRDLPKDSMGVFAFEDGFVALFGNHIDFFHADREDDEILIDLDKQSILVSQIQYLFGSRGDIKLVSVDPNLEGYLIALQENPALADTGDPAAADAQKPEEALYSPDGRRIVRVAIPKNYYYEMEFHARKYNQISEKAFVEVERFEGSLEDFLGKGNRPDIIMFRDQTEIPDYVQKGALVNLLPLFEGQDVYSAEEIIPKAKELLGLEGSDVMYAMAGRFRLLLRTSDGAEYDADGKCDAVSYLKWYDRYLTENEIGGMGKMEEFLYGNLGAFYREDTAEAFFTSDDFRELLSAYREVCDHHKGSLDLSSAPGKSEKMTAIAQCPRWNATYSLYQLTEPGVKMQGIPGIDGADHVYMRLEFPMSILNTSDCKEEAFDFIMYYNSQKDLLMVGEGEASYGKSGNTPAIFSIYEEHLRQDIYESERPYCSSYGESFYTEEQSDQLRFLISQAVSDSKAQRDIYAMFTEETAAYLNGSKSLDSVCEILQNRAELYLKERN